MPFMLTRAAGGSPLHRTPAISSIGGDGDSAAHPPSSPPLAHIYPVHTIAPSPPFHSFNERDSTTNPDRIQYSNGGSNICRAAV
ncbi:hypothetical protein GALMADRAFT_231478 [Galerina marginata CBS 339.88]|uniref:Uncharacterized protein n=1 Tax=Galerina marginata (strain CBS 339.88) TaxID=685588 RepID=A0A067SKQ1_GALM3|nr:hypothetical protein GALMADRAFT_231478 [Galerina marginata CBS 339.88]